MKTLSQLIRVNIHKTFSYSSNSCHHCWVSASSISPVAFLLTISHVQYPDCHYSAHLWLLLHSDRQACFVRTSLHTAAELTNPFLSSYAQNINYFQTHSYTHWRAICFELFHPTSLVTAKQYLCFPNIRLQTFNCHSRLTFHYLLTHTLLTPCKKRSSHPHIIHYLP